jgi:hypothetical protein
MIPARALLPVQEFFIINDNEKYRSHNYFSNVNI